jgi:hypothetical protein
LTARQTKIPAALPARIEYVMRRMYGSRWRTKAASALGIGRMTLHRWMSGDVPASNVDLDMLALIERERGSRMAQTVELDGMARALNKHLENA